MSISKTTGPIFSNLLLSILFMVVFLEPSSGQSIANSNQRMNGVTSTKSADLPPWAEAHHYNAKAHAYFPDYYVYYDAKRRGYVFWQNGKWSFTPALPPFLEKVDLRKSRIKLVEGLSLDLYPQRSYPRMMKLYPANPENMLVPVPTPLHGKP
jgi:hypothetical protein